MIFTWVGKELADIAPFKIRFDGVDDELVLHNALNTSFFYVIDYSQSELYHFNPFGGIFFVGV